VGLRPGFPSQRGSPIPTISFSTPIPVIARFWARRPRDRSTGIKRRSNAATRHKKRSHTSQKSIAVHVIPSSRLATLQNGIGSSGCLTLSMMWWDHATKRSWRTDPMPKGLRMRGRPWKSSGGIGRLRDEYVGWVGHSCRSLKQSWAHQCCLRFIKAAHRFDNSHKR